MRPGNQGRTDEGFQALQRALSCQPVSKLARELTLMFVPDAEGGV